MGLDDEVRDEPAEGDEHGDDDLRGRALCEEHDERGEEQLAEHLDELPVPGTVLVLGVEETVALLAARRLQHEPLVVGVQDEPEEERDAHRVHERAAEREGHPLHPSRRLAARHTTT